MVISTTHLILLAQLAVAGAIFFATIYRAKLEKDQLKAAAKIEKLRSMLKQEGHLIISASPEEIRDLLEKIVNED